MIRNQIRDLAGFIGRGKDFYLFTKGISGVLAITLRAMEEELLMIIKTMWQDKGRKREDKQQVRLSNFMAAY